jgi:DNA gyrase/topoisomerase IV subunit B
MVMVRDYGRGVPFGIRENGENVLVSIYSKSHTGGKFEEGAYKNASGLNGIGAKCACLSAEYFKVTSFRSGKFAEASFYKGDLVDYTEGITDAADGTFVSFVPDKEVFNNGEIGYKYSKICEDLKNISYLYNGIIFYIKNDDTGESKEYCAKNGIKDFIKDNLSTPLHRTIQYNKVSDGVDELEIAFQWGAKKETSYVFVNGLLCPEGGSPITGAKTAITRTFNSL